MDTAKKIILPSVFTAVLIGGQFVLSGISGIEVVTVLLLTFSYKFGVKQGLLVANAFSLLRCFIFGFMLNVLILYIVYYNLFVITFALMGNAFQKKYTFKKHILVIIVAVIMTILFTLLDNIITPLLYSFSPNVAKAYFITSLYTLVPQIICTFVSILVLFPILLKVFSYKIY